MSEKKRRTKKKPKESDKPPLRPGTLLMYEGLEDGKVYKREFIIVAKTFMDTRGEPALAYHGFSSLEGRCVRFAAPIYDKPKKKGAVGRWTILVP